MKINVPEEIRTILPALLQEITKKEKVNKVMRYLTNHMCQTASGIGQTIKHCFKKWRLCFKSNFCPLATWQTLLDKQNYFSNVFERLQKRPMHWNIVRQTFEISLYKQCLTVWPYGKHCFKSRILSTMFSKTSKTSYARITQKFVDEQFYVTWHNGQTFCLTRKSQMFDKQCLDISPGPKFILWLKRLQSCEDKSFITYVGN